MKNKLIGVVRLNVLEMFIKDIKETIKKVLLEGKVLRLYQRMRSCSVLILAYHSVSENRDGQADYINSGITTEAKRFDEQMSILRKEFYPVTLDEIADWINGSRSLPSRSVAVTFDDGFADNYHIAAPIMEKYDIRGAIYLTIDSVQHRKLPWFCRTVFLFQQAKRQNQVLTDSEIKRTWNLGNPKENREAFIYYSYPCAKLVGEELENYVEKLEKWFGYGIDSTMSPSMIDFEQARELRRRGHLIGNHTLSHGNLAHIPPESLHHEIAGANEILERELGERVEHFSYPHPCLDPQWNNNTLEETKKLGYKTAVLTSFGSVFRNSSPLLLPRLMIANPNAFEFRWKLETALAGIQT
ncbi:MAG: polysaccharide deacetylase family protein [Planctomycetaceae bacterium]|nr:polysaccharide deacetylase family protein [Planctomycetaceae bacterium]